MRITAAILSLMLFFQCTSKTPDAQLIIDNSLEVSGSNMLDNAIVKYTFRDREYEQIQSNGKYEMTRKWEEDSIGLIVDKVFNEGFLRTIAGNEVEVVDSMVSKYSNSINSVHYFAFLPYRLNDAAVVKEYLEEETIMNVNYHKVKVTFLQEGGGKDHEDEFVYWINSSNYFIDYLAYSYLTDGGGMRFRKAYNERIINGLRVVDYINFKPSKKTSLEGFGRAYEEGILQELSRIELEKVEVQPN